jgi:hypothetical protein
MKNPSFWDVTPCGSYNNDVSEERIASMIRVTSIGEIGTSLTITPSESASDASYC